MPHPLTHSVLSFACISLVRAETDFPFYSLATLLSFILCRDGLPVFQLSYSTYFNSVQRRITCFSSLVTLLTFILCRDGLPVLELGYSTFTLFGADYLLYSLATLLSSVQSQINHSTAWLLYLPLLSRSATYIEKQIIFFKLHFEIVLSFEHIHD